MAREAEPDAQQQLLCRRRRRRRRLFSTEERSFRMDRRLPDAAALVSPHHKVTAHKSLHRCTSLPISLRSTTAHPPSPSLSSLSLSDGQRASPPFFFFSPSSTPGRGATPLVILKASGRGRELRKADDRGGDLQEERVDDKYYFNGGIHGEAPSCSRTVADELA